MKFYHSIITFLAFGFIITSCTPVEAPESFSNAKKNNPGQNQKLETISSLEGIALTQLAMLEIHRVLDFILQPQSIRQDNSCFVVTEKNTNDKRALTRTRIRSAKCSLSHMQIKGTEEFIEHTKSTEVTHLSYQSNNIEFLTPKGTPVKVSQQGTITFKPQGRLKIKWKLTTSTSLSSLGKKGTGIESNSITDINSSFAISNENQSLQLLGLYATTSFDGIKPGSGASTKIWSDSVASLLTGNQFEINKCGMMTGTLNFTFENSRSLKTSTNIGFKKSTITSNKAQNFVIRGFEPNGCAMWMKPVIEGISQIIDRI